MQLKSAAFENGSAIPSLYTCDGENISTPLSWHAVPPAAKSLALICSDPDASNGDWVHWVVYNIPPEVNSLPEKIAAQASVEIAGVVLTQGLNSWPKVGYGGPCPPSGTHHYFFKLYALALTPNLPAGLTKHKLLEKIRGHVLAEAQLMGTYARRR